MQSLQMKSIMVMLQQTSNALTVVHSHLRAKIPTASEEKLILKATSVRKHFPKDTR